MLGTWSAVLEGEEEEDLRVEVLYTIERGAVQFHSCWINGEWANARRLFKLGWRSIIEARIRARGSMLKSMESNGPRRPVAANTRI